MDELTDRRLKPVGDRRVGSRLAEPGAVCAGGTNGSQQSRYQTSEEYCGAESWSGHYPIMTHGTNRGLAARSTMRGQILTGQVTTDRWAVPTDVVAATRVGGASSPGSLDAVPITHRAEKHA